MYGTCQKYPITIQEALDSPASLVKKAWAGLNIFDFRVFCTGYQTPTKHAYGSIWMTCTGLECLKHI